FLYNFLNPINTVPVNMLRRAFLPFRLADLLIKATGDNKDLADGVSKLTNAQADLMMIQLKKGAVGTFYWFAGFALGGTALGGFYTGMYTNKQRESSISTPDADTMNLGGVDVSKGVQHALPAQQMQHGATY